MRRPFKPPPEAPPLSAWASRGQDPYEAVRNRFATFARVASLFPGSSLFPDAGDCERRSRVLRMESAESLSRMGELQRESTNLGAQGRSAEVIARAKTIRAHLQKLKEGMNEQTTMLNGMERDAASLQVECARVFNVDLFTPTPLVPGTDAAMDAIRDASVRAQPEINRQRRRITNIYQTHRSRVRREPQRPPLRPLPVVNVPPKQRRQLAAAQAASASPRRGPRPSTSPRKPVLPTPVSAPVDEPLSVRTNLRGKGGRRRGGRKKFSFETPAAAALSPEEQEAKRRERAMALKAREEQRREAEEFARVVAQLEPDGDIPRRRAATVAAAAIHSVQHPLTISTVTQSVSTSSRHNTEDEASPVAPSPAVSTTSATTPSAPTPGPSRKKITTTTTTTTQKKGGRRKKSEEVYCLCREVSYGEMIGCENDDCPIQWFHFKCVGIKVKPKPSHKWYCPECRGERSTIMKKPA